MLSAIDTDSITTETLCTAEEFIGIREQWSDLLEQSTQNSIFLSWEWHYSWWECFAGAKDELQIVVITKEDTLIGLAPLYLQRNTISRKTLRFIGTGEAEADEVVTEYLDFISLPGFEQAVIDYLRQWIRSNKHWRRIEFNYVLQNYLCTQVAEGLKKHYTVESEPNGRVYSVPLETSELQYRENRLSASRNKRLKRCLKALDKDGGGLVRKVICDESEIEDHFAMLKDLHDERWSSKNKRSIFESEKFVAFHLKLLSLLVPQNRANIALYSLNDKPVSAIYVMYSQNTCHYYQSGFSKEGENRYMPLFVSHIEEMNAAREKGLADYDFMRGSASSYKSDFGCQEADMFDITIYRYAVESKLRAARGRIRKLSGSVLQRRQ